MFCTLTFIASLNSRKEAPIRTRSLSSCPISHLRSSATHRFRSFALFCNISIKHIFSSSLFSENKTTPSEYAKAGWHYMPILLLDARRAFYHLYLPEHPRELMFLASCIPATYIVYHIYFEHSKSLQNSSRRQA